MPILLITLKNILFGAGLHFVKKYAAELVYDELVNGLDKLSKNTETKTDDKAVEYLKQDKKEMLKIIKGLV